MGMNCVRGALVSVWLAGALAGGGAWAADKPGAAPGSQGANLPVVFLSAKEPIVAEGRVACGVRVVPPDGGAHGLTNPAPAVARLHGASSQSYPKKSVGFSLEEPAGLLGMEENRHWLLNAAYIDRSLMRHKLAYDLFRSLARPGRPRFAADGRFVELQLNGRYHGVYLLMEHVDRQRLGLRSYRSNDFSHACLYKAIDHGADFAQPGHRGYQQREPDPVARPYWQPLDELDRFVSAAPDREFFEAETGLASRLDVANAMDFHLLVLLTCNADGIDKNFYLARDGQEAGPQRGRFLFAPWDYDGTFGRNWDASPFPAEVWLSNHLFDRLLENPAYRERFVARWQELRAGEFSLATVCRLMDDNARTLGAAVRRNVARWPTTGWPYPDRLGFEEDLAQMKQWTQRRLQWLDRHIQREFGRR